MQVLWEKTMTGREDNNSVCISLKDGLIYVVAPVLSSSRL